MFVLHSVYFFKALFPGSYKGLQITQNVKKRKKNNLSRGKIPAPPPGHQMIRPLFLWNFCGEHFMTFHASYLNTDKTLRFPEYNIWSNILLQKMT